MPWSVSAGGHLVDGAVKERPDPLRPRGFQRDFRGEIHARRLRISQHNNVRARQCRGITPSSRVMPREVGVKTVAQPLIRDNLGRCNLGRCRWSNESSPKLQCSFEQEGTD